MINLLRSGRADKFKLEVITKATTASRDSANRPDRYPELVISVPKIKINVYARATRKRLPQFSSRLADGPEAYIPITGCTSPVGDRDGIGARPDRSEPDRRGAHSLAALPVLFLFTGGFCIIHRFLLPFAAPGL